MADASIRAMRAAAQLNRIGFVEFTTNLVRNVYTVIVQSSMEQLQAYAKFVAEVSKTLEEYQSEAVGGNEGIEGYVKGLLNRDDFSCNSDTLLDLDQAQEELLKKEFAGLGVSAAGGGPKECQPGSKDCQTFEQTVTEEGKIAPKVLCCFAEQKLKREAEHSYTMLKTILQMGLQKIVVTNGEIRTKLTFSVHATDTSVREAGKRGVKSTGWGIGGRVSAEGFLGGWLVKGGMSGGYSSHEIRVSVVNERSAAATNVGVDVVSEVRIQFRTETFPPLEG